MAVNKQLKLTMEKAWRDDIKRLCVNGVPTEYRIKRYHKRLASDGRVLDARYLFLGPDGNPLQGDGTRTIFAGSDWYFHGPGVLKAAYLRDHGLEGQQNA